MPVDRGADHLVAGTDVDRYGFAGEEGEVHP